MASALYVTATYGLLPSCESATSAHLGITKTNVSFVAEKCVSTTLNAREWTLIRGTGHLGRFLLLRVHKARKGS